MLGNWLAKGCGLNLVGGIPLWNFFVIWMDCVGHLCFLLFSCMVCLGCVEVLVWVGGGALVSGQLFGSRLRVTKRVGGFPL